MGVSFQYAKPLTGPEKVWKLLDAQLAKDDHAATASVETCVDHGPSAQN